MKLFANYCLIPNFKKGPPSFNSNSVLSKYIFQVGDPCGIVVFAHTAPQILLKCKSYISDIPPAV